MKVATILVSALATLVAAAPAAEKKVEARGFNDFLNSGFTGFQSSNLNYVFGINNGVDQFAILQQLALQQNLGLNQFDGLFGLNNGAIDLNSLLLMQQLLDLATFAQFGVLSGFD